MRPEPYSGDPPDPAEFNPFRDGYPGTRTVSPAFGVDHGAPEGSSSVEVLVAPDGQMLLERELAASEPPRDLSLSTPMRIEDAAGMGRAAFLRGARRQLEAKGVAAAQIDRLLAELEKRLDDPAFLERAKARAEGQERQRDESAATLLREAQWAQARREEHAEDERRFNRAEAKRARKAARRLAEGR